MKRVFLIIFLATLFHFVRRGALEHRIIEVRKALSHKAFHRSFLNVRALSPHWQR